MKRYLAEFVGTFALVFCGTGAIIINQETHGSITHIGIALTFGMIVMVMIFALDEISGAHLNPAVTVGFFIAKRFSIKEVLPYIFSQTFGGFLATFLLKIQFPVNQNLGATVPKGTDYQSFILEIILAFLLMLVILNVSAGAKEKHITSPIAIGATVGLEALFAGPISGASMNPIRSLAPAIVSGNTHSLWIYLTAPFLGALIAVFIHKFLYQNTQ